MWILTIALTILFVAFKLTGIITWSWLLVISPIPLLLLIILGLAFIVALGMPPKIRR